MLYIKASNTPLLPFHWMPKVLPTLFLSICCSTQHQSFADAQTKFQTIEEVAVTGTRIERADINGVGPVTVIDEQDIEATGITSLELLLQRLPSAAGFGGNQTSAYWVSNGWGTPQINLRGLGINRTLVLINGRRVVYGGTGANSSVDLSMIPLSLISRVEVLKDGASATYGADAIAGVVNLITKDEFDTLEIEGKLAMTERNDGEEKLIDLTWGKSGDRGNIMFNVSYQNNEASPLADRVPCPLAKDSTTQCNGSSSTIGGRTTLPAGTYLSDGTLLTEPTRVNFNQQLGGNGNFYEKYNSSIHGFNYNPYFNAVQPIERYNISSLGKYKLSDQTQLFTELMYTHRKTSQPASPAVLRSIAYKADHPTNPTGTDFILEQRRLLENGARYFVQDVKNWRVVTGIEGMLYNNWSYDAAINWGKNTATDAITNNINTQRVAQTLDTSLCGSNGIPCADYLGYGDVSQDVLNYIVFNQQGTGGNKQISVSANITGKLLTLPAGTVSVASGIEWREEQGWRNPDPFVLAGIALGNQESAISGKSTVREIYGEVNIPLVKSLPLIESLDLDIALRYSDYTSFGNENTYKAGINWQVTPTIKLRGTMTTAFRIPNVPELFGGVSEGNLTTSDPCSGYGTLDPNNVIYQNCNNAGVPLNYTQLGTTILTDRGGNTQLEPESANTYTLGLVFEPLEDLSLTVDYFDIEIENAVREISGSTKLSKCYSSIGLSHEFCSASHHTRNNVNGDINFLSTQRFNTGSETMQGVDVGLAYSFQAFQLSNILDFQATYLDHYESVAFDGDKPFVIDGFIGDGNGGYPHLRANTSLTTQSQHWTANYSIQLIGNGDDFNVNSEIGSKIPTIVYHNVQFSYNLSSTMDISIGIDNLYDKQAPRVASWTDGNTDTMTYDLAGRRGYIRFTYRMD